MTRNFHRWEVDPFFSAAEEVQDSTDRLESVYRTWMHAKSVAICDNDEDEDDSDAQIEFRRRELSTALGTAKWQLEEFERAVSYIRAHDDQCAGDDAPARHRQLIDALRNQITCIENSLLSSKDSRDLKALPGFSLQQEDKDDLALFLRGSNPISHNNHKKIDFFLDTNGKDDEEAPCTTSESVKSKTGLSDCFSTSPSNSDVVLNKKYYLKSNACCLPSEVCASDKGGISCDLIEISIDGVCKPILDSVSAHSCDYKLRRSSENSWSRGSMSDLSCQEIKDNSNTKKPDLSFPSNLTIWSVFKSKRNGFNARISKSSLKRWKDGDANAGDQDQMLHSDSEIEKANGSCWAGGNTNFVTMRDRQNCNGWGEVIHRLRRLRRSFPSSHPLQITSAILVMLGIAGFISFHVA